MLAFALIIPTPRKTRPPIVCSMKPKTCSTRSWSVPFINYFIPFIPHFFSPFVGVIMACCCICDDVFSRSDSLSGRGYGMRRFMGEVWVFGYTVPGFIFFGGGGEFVWAEFGPNEVSFFVSLYYISCKNIDFVTKKMKKISKKSLVVDNQW